MAREFCPQCGTGRVGALRFCRSCAFDYDSLPPAESRAASPAETHDQPTAGVAPSAAVPEASSRNVSRLLIGLALGVAIVIGGFYILNNRIPSIGPSSGVSGANLPPAGAIWFGSSFDPSTFEIRGRTTSISSQTAFSAVARLTREMAGSDLSIRISYNGAVISSSAVTWQGSGDVWGFSPGALMAAGEWRYELVDVGGNVLASGTITAT
jgi:hypothetical protein